MKLWIEEHSGYAKEQVILNNLGLVPFVLKSLNQNVLDEDLYSIGIVGLCKAINGFDADVGVKFSTYAVRAIRNEILMSFRNKHIITVFSLDEPCDLGNGESVEFSEMIADNRKFEEEVIADMQLENMFSSLTERKKR